MSDDRILTCALHYASFGWRVFPLHTILDGRCTCGNVNCTSPGKHPYGALAPSGAKDATTDPAIIANWFGNGKPLNIAICAGEGSGLVILDVDPAHGGSKSLANLESKYGKMPDTAEVMTGGGGKHFYFKHPGGNIRNSAGTLGDGLDVRGHNGYVVAPPSMHISGNEYRWKIDPRGKQPELPPKWLISNVTLSNEVIQEQKTGEKIPQGKRNEVLTSMAGAMRRKGFDEESIYEALQVMNLKRCDPQLDAKELQAIAASVSRYQPEPDQPDDGKIILDNDHPDTIAEAFEKWSIEHCGVIHRYNAIDQWSIFYKDKYQLVADEKEIEQYIRKFIAKKIRIKAKIKQEDGTYKIYYASPDKKLKSNGSVTNVMLWLRDMESVHLLPGQKAPCSLDGSLDPKYILALNNGLLDWHSYPYTLIPHTKEYYNLNYLPYEWHGEKDSEMWIKYLIDATGGDVDLFELLQQWAGYCLMKHDQKEQKFVILFGESSTGKSVFIKVLTHLLGKENISNVPLEKFDDPHFVAQTYGKMLNITDESETHLEEVVETHLKHYTGGTMYMFKKLYQDGFSAYPTAKIMIVTNHLPSFKDTSEGIWRRLIVVPFNNVVPDEKIIKGLAEKIIETEMPGVLKWALEGARKLEKYGFVKPEICKQALADYRRESLPEMQFLDELFETGTEDEKVSCKEFRIAYELWCNEQGIKAKSQKKLCKTLQKMFPLCERKRGRDGLKLDYFYFGIKTRIST